MGSRLAIVVFAAVFAIPAADSAASSIYGRVILTGHDPDFHAHPDSVENRIGAMNLLNRYAERVNQTGGAVAFLYDPLWVNPAPCPSLLPCHLDSVAGFLAANPAFIPIDLFTFRALPDIGDYFGTPIGAYMVPSDFGGSLTGGSPLDPPITLIEALIYRKEALKSYLLGGGGMVVLAEQGMTPTNFSPVPPAMIYSFLPFAVSSHIWDQEEIDFVLTQFGLELGILPADIAVHPGHTQPSFSHVYFDGDPHGRVIDLDADGRVISYEVSVVPEPGTLLLLASGLLGFLRRK
jgi:hypothetical protein